MRLLVLAPLRIEALALRSALPGIKVRRTGMGRPSGSVEIGDVDAVAVAGLCGAVDPDLRTGDVVLGTELRAADVEPIACPGSALLAEPVRRLGLRAVSGPIFSSPAILGRSEREELRETGVVAVDMESAWIAQATGERPLAVLRVVVDTADRRLASARTAVAGIRGLWTLRRGAAALVEWAEFCTAPDGASLRPQVA